MNALVRYDAARAALSAALRVDEVKDIRDKAQAMAAYARQAQDTEMVEWATEIKVRAERRAGELLRDMAATGERAASGGDRNASSHRATMAPTLEALGVSRDESSRWQKLAAVSEDQFEQAVAAAKEVAGEVTTAAMLRMARAAVEQDTGADEPEVEPAPSLAAVLREMTTAIRCLKRARRALPTKAGSVVVAIISNLTRIRETLSRGEDL